MLPDSATNHAVHCHNVDAELTRKSAMVFYMARAHGDHFIVGEFGNTMTLATHLQPAALMSCDRPALAVHIVHVVFVRAVEQVFRRTALRVVAGMANARLAFGDWTAPKQPSDAMGSNLPSCFVAAQAGSVLPIAISVLFSEPRRAAIGIWLAAFCKESIVLARRKFGALQVGYAIRHVALRERVTLRRTATTGRRAFIVPEFA
jgi:hypothetical protein